MLLIALHQSRILSLIIKPIICFGCFSHEQVNLAFCSKLVQSLAPIPLLGPKVRLLLSSSCTQSFLTRAAQKIKGATSVASLRGGIPSDSITPGDICILLSPSNQNDYQLASKIVSEGVAKALVIVNGLAKVR